MIVSSSSWRCFQMERVNGATPDREASFPSFRTILRKSVLKCIGKESQGPFLEKSGDGVEDLWLNPGRCLGSKYSTTHHHPGAPPQEQSREEKGGDSAASSPFMEAGPLAATKTVLLVKGEEASTVHKGLQHRVGCLEPLR